MLTYPTLSIKPNINFFNRELVIDPTQRYKFENGYVQTTPKFTGVSKQWGIRYSFLTASDKSSLLDFQDNVSFGQDIFNWVNPQNEITYQVRFDKILKFTISNGTSDLWDLQFKFIESKPSSEI